MAVRRITTLQGPTLKADDGTTAATIADSTGQITVGATNGWKLPVNKGTNDKYVLQINTTSGAAGWAESLTAPELSGATNVKINKYETPFSTTGNTQDGGNIRKISNITTIDIGGVSDANIVVGQYISGTGIPTNTTITAIDTAGTANGNDGTITISADATSVATGTTFSIQKTPGEKNGGSMTLAGTNFGANVGELTVNLVLSNGTAIAAASTLSALSGGITVTATWNGTEGDYATELDDWTGNLYAKVTKSGLSSNVLNTGSGTTSDPVVANSGVPTQTGGDGPTSALTATSLGVYGGSVSGGGTDPNTKILLNFDKAKGQDFEDSTNSGDEGTANNDGKGYTTRANGDANIQSSPFGDGKSAMWFDGTGHIKSTSASNDFNLPRTGTAWTVELWAQRTSADNDSHFIRLLSQSAQTGSGYTGWSLMLNRGNSINQENYLQFGKDAGGTMMGGTDSGGQTEYKLIRYRWHHVAVSSDGTNILLFIDGRLLQKRPGTDLSDWALTNGTLLIGARDGGSYWEGFLDEIRITSGVQVYTGDFTVPTSRLSTTWAANPFGGVHTTANSTASNVKFLLHSNQTQTNDLSTNNMKPHSFGGVPFQKAITTNRGSTDGANWNDSAWYFNGTSDRISYADHTDWSLGGTADQFTMELWVMPTSTQTGWLFGQADGGSTNTAWGMHIASNVIKFRVKHTGGHTDITSTATLSNNVWTHVAICRTASNVFRLYINGSAHTGADFPYTWGSSFIDSTSQFVVGAGAAASGYFEGYISDLRITTGISGSVYSANFSVPTAPLTRTWSAATGINATTGEHNVVFLLNGGTSTQTVPFLDESSSPKALTPTKVVHSQGNETKDGGVGIDAFASWPGNGKQVGSSGVWFGGDDYIWTTTGPNITGGVWTIEWWMWPMRLPNAAGISYIFDMRNSSNLNNIRCYTEGMTGGLKLNFVSGTSTTVIFDDTAIPYNQWTHCAISQSASSGTTLRAYFNGKFVGAGTATSQFNTGAADIYYGRLNTPANYYYKGFLDGFRINSTAISSTEVTTEWGNFSQPTKIYGAYGNDTPDVGTITLSATDAASLDFSLVGGTTLPSGGTLALAEGTDSGNTRKATITGKFGSAVTSDTSTTVRIKAQDPTDATRAIEFGGASGGYTGMTITQQPSGRPVGFGGRRYMGTGEAKEITEFGFQPDMVWIKNRLQADKHISLDSVRGSAKWLSPNTDDAEGTDTTLATFPTKHGFTLGTHDFTNKLSEHYICWAWKAGGRPTGTFPASLTGGIGNGTLASTSLGWDTDWTNGGANMSVIQSVNTNTGFSITKWTSSINGQNGGKIPHNLGSGVGMVFIKCLSVATKTWIVFHKDLGYTSSRPNYMHLDTNAAKNPGHSSITGDGTSGGLSGTDEPNMFAQNFYQYGTNDPAGGVNSSYVMYAWKPVANLSAFGSHTAQITTTKYNTGVSNAVVGANGYCGFKPRYVMIKRHNASGGWNIFDSFRDSQTTDIDNFLIADAVTAENAGVSNGDVTFLSQGFTTGNHDIVGAVGQSYIWAAFA